MKLLSVLVASMLSVLAACHSNGDTTSPDAAGPDAPDGTGCTPLTPRTEPVESFVGPTGLQARMAALIDGAQTSLDIQMYLWNVKDLATRVVNAKQRGVAVRVILDPDEAGNQAVEPMFTTGSVPWKTSSRIYTYAHAKYLIVDHTQVAIMSMNFNTGAMSNERNYGLIDRDPEDIADAQSIFDYDWKLANGATGTPPNLTCTRLIVSPVNSAARLVDHIKSSTTTLDVEVMYLTDSNVRAAVADANARGVKVRVIIQDPMDPSVAIFKGEGIPVKQPPSSIYVHAKLVIADQVAFVGSENMSFTSLTKNREVGALAFEPTAYMPIQTQFDSDWNVSTTIP